MLCVILLLSVVAVFNISCAHTIPNTEVCATLVADDGGPGDAFCRKINTGAERIIDKAVWSKQVNTYLHIAPEDLGDLFKFIEDVCNETKNCKKEEVTMIIYRFQSQRLYMYKGKSI